MLGDFVLIDGTPRKVEAITKKKVGYHRTENDSRMHYARACEVQPIEITKDWLLTNDFIEHRDKCNTHTAILDGYILHDPLPFEHSAYYITDSGPLVKVEAYYGNYVRKVHYPMAQYLHQLQQACKVCGVVIDWKL